jgi:DNA polymerase III epsilon subunit-like protein
MIDLVRTWHELPYAVLDFETDGVDPSQCMPVSVACARFWQGDECDSFYSLLNPGRPIAPEASAIHGITDADVAGAPSLEMVAGGILRVATGALPVAYNSSFDRAILHRFVTGSDCPMFSPQQEWICPLVIIRGVDRFVGGKGRHKLETTCARWNVPMDSAHNALSDARATGRLLWKLRERLGDMSAEKLIAAVCQRRAEQERDFQAYKARVAT